MSVIFRSTLMHKRLETTIQVYHSQTQIDTLFKTVKQKKGVVLRTCHNMLKVFQSPRSRAYFRH